MISAVLVACDEAPVLRESLASVLWVDEVVVIDLQSVDESAEVARKFGAAVVQRERVPYVELVRQEAIDATSGDWILVLDPDEAVTGELASSLRRISLDPASLDAYSIPRINLVFGEELISAAENPYSDSQIRFFRRGAITWPQEIHAQPSTTGSVACLRADTDGYLLHNQFPTVESFLSRVPRYAPPEADRLLELDRAPTSVELVYWPAYYLRRYLFESGGHHFRPERVVLSCLMAMYAFTSYAMAWQRARDGSARSRTREVAPDIWEAARLIATLNLEFVLDMLTVAIAGQGKNSLASLHWRVCRKILTSLRPLLRPRTVNSVPLSF